MCVSGHCCKELMVQSATLIRQHMTFWIFGRWRQAAGGSVPAQRRGGETIKTKKTKTKHEIMRNALAGCGGETCLPSIKLASSSHSLAPQ